MVIGFETPEQLADALAKTRDSVTERRLVIIESPYADDIDRNTIYGRRALHDALSRNEAPIASHLLYTQPGVLRDDDPHERQWGIDAGLAWHTANNVTTVVYADYGISRGMQYGIDYATKVGSPVVYRLIGVNPDAPH